MTYGGDWIIYGAYYESRQKYIIYFNRQIKQLVIICTVFVDVEKLSSKTLTRYVIVFDITQDCIVLINISKERNCLIDSTIYQNMYLEVAIRVWQKGFLGENKTLDRRVVWIWISSTSIRLIYSKHVFQVSQASSGGVVQKKSVFKNIAELTGKHLWQRLFLS